MSNKKSCLKSKIFLSIPDFLDGASKSDLFKRVGREIELSEMKEIHSKEEMVPRYCSEEEYNSIEASTDYQNMIKEEQEIAELRHKSVFS